MVLRLVVLVLLLLLVMCGLLMLKKFLFIWLYRFIFWWWIWLKFLVRFIVSLFSLVCVGVSMVLWNFSRLLIWLLIVFGLRWMVLFWVFSVSCSCLGWYGLVMVVILVVVVFIISVLLLVV